MSATTNVLFPIEIINRELDFRLWLAALYARKGTRIFIGQHDILYALSRDMRGGIYVGKNLFRNHFPCELSRYERLKRNEFSLVHLDEEGLCPGRDAQTWVRGLELRLDASCLSRDDYVATWGDIQKNHYRTRHVIPEHVRTTGHPRFDLYKKNYRAYFAEQVRRIQDRFGEFVLVNTNFVYANNGLGLLDSFTNCNIPYDVNLPASRLNHFNGWALQCHLICNVVKLVNRLSLEFPKWNFVIRPHPSENWEYYRTVFHKIRNVHVVHEGGVAPWLLACRALIHDGCTTGIEAHLADCNIINYKSYTPKTPWQEDLWIPGIFGQRCTDEEEVIEALIKFESGQEGAPPRFTDDALGLLDNFRHISFDKLIATMEAAHASPRARSRVPATARVGFRAALIRTKNLIKSTIRPLFPRKQRAYRFFSRNVFYGFDRQDISRKLNTIQQMTGRELHYQFIGDSVMSIDPA